MRLYIVTHAAGPTWVGTQAEAKSIARETGGEWVQYDVPTDKDGLLGFLNHCDAVRPGEAAAADAPPAPAEPTAQELPAQRPTPAGAAKLRAGRECDDLVESILEADGFVLSNLFGACIERLQRLKREIPA